MTAYQTILDQFRMIQIFGRLNDLDSARATIKNLEIIISQVKEDPEVAKNLPIINKQIGIFEGLCK